MTLKKKADQRLIRGHEWVFSNELLNPPKVPEEEYGCLVQLQNHQGNYLATGYYNHKSLIAARVISRKPLTVDGAHWLDEKMASALARREAVFNEPYYRLIFGESDGLPGLVVDRFGDVLVAQVTTAGMERLRGEIESALHRVVQPSGIVWRADDHFRELEGLPLQPPEVTGQVPDTITVKEGGLTFSMHPLGGQKTGWFYDQRDNRLRLHKYARGKTVLDVFSYAGAWALHALSAGAEAAVCIDRSREALAAAEMNAQLQQVQLETVCGDAFKTMREMNKASRKFDIVILDPPPLIKRRKDFEAGLQAYFQLNRLASQLVSRGGLLVTCSCSHHLDEAQLVDIVRHTGLQFGRAMAIAEKGGQSIDHPIHPAMAETQYIKSMFVWLD